MTEDAREELRRVLREGRSVTFPEAATDGEFDATRHNRTITAEDVAEVVNRSDRLVKVPL